MEKISRFFCSECGKWLGVKNESALISGIYPYCPRCKKQVSITEIQVVRNKSKNISAECRQI